MHSKALSWTHLEVELHLAPLSLTGALQLKTGTWFRLQEGMIFEMARYQRRRFEYSECVVLLYKVGVRIGR